MVRFIDVKANIFGASTFTHYLDDGWVEYNGDPYTAGESNFQIETAANETINVIFTTNYWYVSPRKFEVTVEEL